MEETQQLILSAILGDWLVGLICGANLVLFFLVVSAPLSRLNRGIHRRFILCSTTFQLLISVAHAATSLADFLVCFTTSTRPVLEYLADKGRATLLVQLVLYTINIHVGDSFIVWRVWVLWDRWTALTIPFFLLNTSTSVIGLVAIADLSRTHSISVTHVRDLILSSLITTLIVQGTGMLLISWRIWSIPIVSASARPRWNCWMPLWLLVESGGLYSGMTLFAIVIMGARSPFVDLAISPLCQIATFVPFTIILREHYKITARSRAAALTAPRVTFLTDERELDSRTGGARRKMPFDDIAIEIETSVHEKVDARDLELKAKLKANSLGRSRKEPLSPP